MLTTPQIVEALFGSTSLAQRRLLRLLELGVVARFRPQRADGGSYPYHWVLDQAGPNSSPPSAVTPFPDRVKPGLGACT